MSTRITATSATATSLANLQGQYARLSRLQEQLTSGKVISRPSDSPTGTIAALSLRGEIRTTDQYSANADDGLAWLGTADTALKTVTDLVQRVRALTVQGASTGNTGPEARAAISTELAGLRASLVGEANSTYLGRPVFGGTTGGGVAFATDGSYVGDSGQVTRRIGQQATVRVDVGGAETFGTGSSSLFAVIDQIRDHLANDPGAVAGDLSAIDTAFARVKLSVSDVGARYARVETARQTADDRVLSLKSTLSGVEDIDLPKTILEQSMQQTAYQASLSATAKILQPSLLDFLR
jgi:flagellar hook-associated protein 3 FlgL